MKFESAKDSTLHVRRRLIERLDVTPWAVPYALLCAAWASAETRTAAAEDDWSAPPIGLTVATLMVLIGHLLLVLFTYWNLKVYAWVRLKTSDEKSASCVCVYTLPHKGVSELCDLNITQEGVKWTSFQSRRFVLEDSSFRMLQYPTKNEISSYLGGDETAATVDVVEWPLNVFEIPKPRLEKLLIEQFLSPFFLFQVLCVLLWMLDEYWMYSVFTLMMLVLFELIVATTRLRNLSMLQEMRKPPVPVSVLKGKTWRVVSSAELKPHDYVRVPSGTECPADVLLINGSCVVDEAMLTGESVPKSKNGVVSQKLSVLEMAEKLDMNDKHAHHVVLSGTHVLRSSFLKNSEAEGYVLATGYGTSQGELMRTILFATQRVSADNREAYAFIGVLLVFALIAASHVFYQGYTDTRKRSQWKLLLHSVMVVTSVVPPELPMQLSLAVNTSLARLLDFNVFCTEPYRIPFAGKLDFCCFDKTGTLTSDEYRIKGIALLDAPGDEFDPLLTKTSQLHAIREESTVLVMAGCHDLVSLPGNRVGGDPTEREALNAIGWVASKSGSCASRKAIGTPTRLLKIHKRNPFRSSLKRMSVVAEKFNHDRKPAGFCVLCKGAPEEMKSRFVRVPEWYQSSYEALMKKGLRVLAMGYKEIPYATPSRDECEVDLNFVGLLTMDSPLKAGTKKAIKDLMESGHRVVVITGDNALAARAVASRLGLIHGTPEFFHPQELKWKPSNKKFKDFPKNASLVLTGQALENLRPEDFSLDALEAVSVFARFKPRQKEYVVLQLKTRHTVLMCGDGTNDVGALKQADVGVSVINAPPESTYTEGEPIKLGDASIASAFTSKTPGISSVVHIVRQGRCTLVTTVQMYKILALNCMVSAYAMTSLYAKGVKSGDAQSTLVGMALAVLFAALSYSSPSTKTSSIRPVTTVFSKSVGVSLAGQLFSHLSAIVFATAGVESNGHPDDDFSPSEINTLVFLTAFGSQISVFIVNYRGEPFMVPLKKHLPLLYASLASYVAVLVLTLGCDTFVGEYFELVPLAWPTRLKILAVVAANLLSTAACEHISRRL